MLQEGPARLDCNRDDFLQFQLRTAKARSVASAEIPHRPSPELSVAVAVPSSVVPLRGSLLNVLRHEGHRNLPGEAIEGVSSTCVVQRIEYQAREQFFIWGVVRSAGYDQLMANDVTMALPKFFFVAPRHPLLQAPKAPKV